MVATDMPIEQSLVTDTALLRLLQLVSPALPVGAYAYSQGLEYAVDVGWVSDEESTLGWIGGVLSDVLAWTDLAVLIRLYAAWNMSHAMKVRQWNARLYALRETAELRAEDHHLGSSLALVLYDQGIAAAKDWRENRPTCFATLFALAAVEWSISPRAMLLGYAWSWAESQVAVAIKLAPLGQSAGQRVLSALLMGMTGAVDIAMATDDEAVGRCMPALALASMRHERLYSRLFRS